MRFLSDTNILIARLSLERFVVDFIGVGAARSGTTWIAQALEEHPQVCLSKPKELHFFSKRTLMFPTSNIDMSERWYKSRYSHCKPDSMKGEFSTSYLVDNDAPRLIKEKFPDVKLIISLRNPIDALFSHYHYSRFVHPLSGTFEEFLLQYHKFIDFYRYEKYIRRYLDFFPLERIHIILFDDIVNTPIKVLHNLYRFLNIKTNFLPTNTFRKVNQHACPRFHLLRYVLSNTKKILDSNPFIRRFYKSIKVDDFGLFLREWNSQPKEPPHMDEETRVRLSKIFHRDNKALEKIIGISLDHWN